MKAVVAIDSFKGSMSSMEAGMAARDGILAAKPDAEVVVSPLADGGEGTTDALVEGLGGTFVNVTVTGPMGTPVEAKYGILPDGRTAVMEMAEAGGIILVDRHELDPWKASPTGVGEMIKDAIARGCREFIVGIGGSATTEGGIGMLQALGYRFYDKDAELLPPLFESLGRIWRVESSGVIPELKDCHFRIACDVTNPLCGEEGCVYIYGPQKGVKESEKEFMDSQMAHYAEKTAEFCRTDNSAVPGAGAAGGLGFAFLSYFPNAELAPGIGIVLDALNMRELLKDADVVVTGEGRLDGQTAMGKVPVGLAHLAKEYGCTVVAFGGGVTEEARAVNDEGIDAFFPIVRGITTLDEAMIPKNAKRNMTLAVEQVFRLL